MVTLTPEEILKATGGKLLHYGENPYCSGVSTDTRTVRAGELFIALKGETFDGHLFLSAAYDKGVSAVLVSDVAEGEAAPRNITAILVSDTLRALEDIACFYRKRFSIPVVAVTGSNGKTTTKDMITHLLGKKFQVCSTEKNYNNEIGLSKTLLSISSDTDVCVVEMGMRGLGQIQRLCEIAKPTIGVLTNVGTAHIGILGSQDNIARAKRELVESLPIDGKAVLNYDDSFISQMGRHFHGQVIAYGVHGNYTVRAGDIRFEKDFLTYMCTCFDEAFKVKLLLLGIHHVYDSLAAVATARILGIDVNRIQKGLSSFVPEAQRQRVLSVRGVTVLDDSYNASPESMEMAFLALRQLRGNRYFLLLGDMGELGEKEEALHYALGQKAAEMGFDGLIAVGKAARFIGAGARDRGMSQVLFCTTNEEAVEALQAMTREGDVVLAKASRFMHFEKIIGIWEGS